MTQELEIEQEARARAALSRGQAEPTSLAEVLGQVAGARAAWERRRLAVVETDCPDCRIDSPKGQACSFRGQDFCHHAAEIELRARQRVREANLRQGQVPAPFHRRIVLGDFQVTAAIAAARRMVAREGKLAIFSGGVGAGKTFGAGVAIADRGGFFLGAAALDPFGNEVNDLLKHCAKVGLLVLDDLGAGRSVSDVAKARAEQLVCARWDAGLDTIATTNLLQDEFWPLYGGKLGRVADRLSQDAIGWVRCTEESQRTPEDA